MANICDTTYFLKGSENAVNVFYNVLTTFTNKENIPLKQLLEKFDISDDIYCSGYIYYFEKDVANSGILLEVESKWEGCHEVFDKIIEKFAETYGHFLTINYMEIEPMWGIFKLENPSNYFEDAQCYVRPHNFNDDEECDFYTTFEDAIERWFNVMQDYVNITEWEKLTIDDKINYINNFEYDDEDTSYLIFYFE
jgi:hypothetical protein